MGKRAEILFKEYLKNPVYICLQIFFFCTVKTAHIRPFCYPLQLLLVIYMNTVIIISMDTLDTKGSATDKRNVERSVGFLFALCCIKERCSAFFFLFSFFPDLFQKCFGKKSLGRVGAPSMSQINFRPQHLGAMVIPDVLFSRLPQTQKSGKARKISCFIRHWEASRLSWEPIFLEIHELGNQTFCLLLASMT